MSLAVRPLRWIVQHDLTRGIAKGGVWASRRWSSAGVTADQAGTFLFDRVNEAPAAAAAVGVNSDGKRAGNKNAEHHAQGEGAPAVAEAAAEGHRTIDPATKVTPPRRSTPTSEWRPNTALPHPQLNTCTCGACDPGRLGGKGVLRVLCITFPWGCPVLYARYSRLVDP